MCRADHYWRFRVAVAHPVKNKNRTADVKKISDELPVADDPCFSRQDIHPRHPRLPLGDTELRKAVLCWHDWLVHVGGGSGLKEVREGKCVAERREKREVHASLGEWRNV